MDFVSIDNQNEYRADLTFNFPAIKDQFGSNITSADIDMLRLVIQNNIYQPVLRVKSHSFIGVPLENITLEHAILHLPIPSHPNIRPENQIFGRCEVMFQISDHLYNNMNSSCSPVFDDTLAISNERRIVTTNDIEFSVDNIRVNNFFEGNHYTLLRLRPGEGVTFECEVEWLPTVNGAWACVVYTPTWDFSFEIDKTYHIRLESRGFWLMRKLLQAVGEEIIQQLKRHWTIFKRLVRKIYLEDNNDDESEEFGIYGYEIHNIENKNNIISIQVIITPTLEKDEQIGIRNAVEEVFNNVHDNIFMFNHIPLRGPTAPVRFTILNSMDPSPEPILKLLDSIFTDKINFWKAFIQKVEM